MSLSRSYLGRVRRVSQTSGGYRYAVLEPILESDESGREWKGPIQDLNAEFPSRGRVFWHSAPAVVQHGSVWQFQIEEHPNADRPDEDTDFWQVVSPRLPVEIVDVRGSDDDALRVALTISGLPILPDPLNNRVALWTADELVIGVVRITRAEGMETWLLEEDPTKLAVCGATTGWIKRVDCEGSRLLLSPTRELGARVGMRNWCSDEDFARTTLHHLRKLDRVAADALGVTEAVFRTHLKTLAQKGFFGTEGTIDGSRMSRTEVLLKTIERNHELLERAALALLESPAIAARVDSAVNLRVEQQVAERKQEVESAILNGAEELTNTQATVELLSKQRHALEVAVVEVEENLAGLQARLESKAAKFEAALVERLRVLAEQPESIFADLAVIRAALTGSRAPSPAGDQLIKGDTDLELLSSIALVPPFDESVLEVQTIEELKRTLMKHALQRRLDPTSLLKCHSACLAGAFPILCGDQAEELLEAYAATISGGRALWIPVGASILEPTQLLGRVDGALRRFVPYANGLAELLRHACNSDDVHIVVFDGFNRAPVEGWLFPFLHARASMSREGTDRGLPLVPRGSVEAHDPFASIARLQWPRNVLAVGIPSYGSAVLPIPAELWRFAALIDVDGDSSAEGVRSFDAQPGTLLSTRVSTSHWCAWSDESAVETISGISQLERLAAAVPIGSRRADVAVRMVAALCMHGLQLSDALRQALVATLVPRFVGAEGKLNSLAEASGIGASSEWSSVLDAAKRMIE